MNYNLIQIAEFLLETANISIEMDSRIRSLFFTMDYERLFRCIEWLKNNQQEPVNPAKQNMQRWKLQRYGL